MAKRSLKASTTGIQKAKQVFERREWTQEYLASAVGLQTRQSIWKFFTGRPIERYLFIDICFQLDLDWEEIVDRPMEKATKQDSAGSSIAVNTDGKSFHINANIQAYWQEIQPKVYQLLQERYQLAKHLLDIYQSVDFTQIAIELNVDPYRSSQQWLEISEIQKKLDYPVQADFREMPFQYQSSRSKQTPSRYLLNSNSLLPTVIQESQSFSEVVKQKTRIIVLGKAGSGKSCLLQSIALQYCRLSEEESKLPIYISLSQMVPSLIAYEQDTDVVTWLCSTLSRHFTELPDLWQGDFWHWLLQSGKVVFLLDGLDELSRVSREKVNQIITQLSQNYHEITIVMATRLGTLNTFYPNFYPVTISELSNPQIEQFADKWFNNIAPLVSESLQHSSNSVILCQFTDELFQRKNQRFLDLARTPLILHLLCLSFCERRQFPKNRARFYEYIIEVFLVQWNYFRCFDREQTLLVADELVEILSQIAFSGFIEGRVSFDKSSILLSLSNYLIHHPTLSQVDNIRTISYKVLEDFLVRYGLLIEVAKGIYSFAHCAIQEFFCARYLTTIPYELSNTFSSREFLASGQQEDSSIKSLQQVADHIFDTQWYEVILLVLESSPEQKKLLHELQGCLENKVSQNGNLLEFLHWIDKTAISISTKLEHSPEIHALRAFYLGSICNLGLDLAYGLDHCLAWQLPIELSQELDLIKLINSLNSLISDPSREKALQIILMLQTIDSQSIESVQADVSQLFQIIYKDTCIDSMYQSLRSHGIQLREKIAQANGIFNYWEWISLDIKLLEQYYWANIFLLECYQRVIDSPSYLKQQVFPKMLRINASASVVSH
jgi:predicted NACHT family NTPase